MLVAQSHMIQFYYPGTSYVGFGVRPDGKVYAEIALQPRRTYTFAVFLAYKGVDYKGNAIEGSEAANVRISTQGKVQC